MGDRTVFGFRNRENDIPVFLYSHWGGSSRIADLQTALQSANPRWNDPSYATRISISYLIGEAWRDETGYGITAGHNNVCCPDYDDIIIVTWGEQTVHFVSAMETQTIVGEVSFEQFLSMTDNYSSAHFRN